MNQEGVIVYCRANVSLDCLRQGDPEGMYTTRNRREIARFWVAVPPTGVKLLWGLQDLDYVCAPCRGFLISRIRETGARIDLRPYAEIVQSLDSVRAMREQLREEVYAETQRRADRFLADYGRPSPR